MKQTFPPIFVDGFPHIFLKENNTLYYMFEQMKLVIIILAARA